MRSPEWSYDSPTIPFFSVAQILLMYRSNPYGNKMKEKMTGRDALCFELPIKVLRMSKKVDCRDKSGRAAF